MRTIRSKALGAAIGVSAAVGLVLAPVSASGQIDISGDASGLTVQVNALGVPLDVGPLPVAATPPGGDTQVLGADVPGVVGTGVLSVASQPTGDGVSSVAQVVGANVLAGTVAAGVVTARCTSTPDGSTGSSELVDASALGIPLAVSPPPNTEVPLPLLGALYLNEQAGSTGGGSSSMTVNAVRVALTSGLTTGGIVISHAGCAAAGVTPGGVTTTPGGPAGPAVPVGATPTLTG